MPIQQVEDSSGWSKLLAYCTECIREENRLRYVIEPKYISQTCWFLNNFDGSFLRHRAPSLSIQFEDRRHADRAQVFVLGRPNRRPPSVCFGYPFYVDRRGKVMPLLYIDVSGRLTDGGICLIPESPEVEINFAALWEVLPGDHADREISLDEIIARFDDLEVEAGESRFDRTLKLLLSCLEELSGHPVRCLGREQFDPGHLPKDAVVDCPLLFHIRYGYTNQLLRELNDLRQWHTWDEVGPALRQLLTESDDYTYPDVPELAADRHLYLAPVNDRQRQAIAASEQCPITVVTGPPGTGKSQLILNIVGNAVLRGETVLIASRNNKAVNVVYDRFFSKVGYLGLVRSGKLAYRKQLPGEMRRAFSTVRGSGAATRLEEVQAERKAILREIDEQRRRIVLIERLLHDRDVYQREVNDLLMALPESLGACVKSSRVRLDEEDGSQLNAAVRSLLEETQDVIAVRQSLAENVREVLISNTESLKFLDQLETVEQRLGLPISLRRNDVDVTSFGALVSYLSAWETFLKALLWQDDVAEAQREVESARRNAQAKREVLSDDLIAAVSSASEIFDGEQETSLRQSLDHIRKDSKGAQIAYQRLTASISDVRAGSRVIDHWLENIVESSPEAPLPLGLMALEQLFSSKDNVLEAHRVGVVRADLTRRLDLLRRERDSKVAESREMIAGLDEQIATARAEVPALLLPQVETTIERADRKTWRILSDQLRKIDTWATRVGVGKLTLVERIRGMLSRNWADQALQTKLRAIDVTGTELHLLNPVEEPGVDASFGDWVAYVHDWYSFAQVCALTMQRTYMQEMLTNYRVQSEQEIDVKSVELREVETQFTESLVRLPEAVSDAMLVDGWPFERVDTGVLQTLDELQKQCDDLMSQYTAWVERLAGLQAGHPTAKALEPWVDALVPQVEPTGTMAAQSTTPEAVVALISTWLQFSEATEAEKDLRRLCQEQSEKEEALDALWAQLPEGMRHIVDWSQVPHSMDILQSVMARVTDLCGELHGQIEQWKALHDRAVDVVQHNALKSPALDKVLKRAAKDAQYFSDLLGKTYSEPEQLDSDLRTWTLVVRVWALQAQLATVSANLRGLPALEEAHQTLSELVEKRLQLGGEALLAKWHSVASELEPSTVRSINSYISAIEALTRNQGAGYRTLKQRTEAHFADALKLFPVWMTTNLSTQDLPLEAELFDYVIIDEASQCDVPSALSLLFRGKRLVIIGDENQLSHIASLPDSVHEQVSEKHGIGLGTSYDYKQHSLFRFAFRSVLGKPDDIFLYEHYRSCAEIIEFVNRCGFYQRDFEIKTDLEGIPTLYREIGCGVYWLDVQGKTERPGRGQVFNQEEIRAIRDVTVRLDRRLNVLLDPELKRRGKPLATIGIVTPFREQANRIDQAISASNLPQDRVLVGTVHTYQGDERDVMIFSAVATGDMLEWTYRFMAQHLNLLNVAATRARLTLIIAGDHQYFMDKPKKDYYRKLAEYAYDLGHVYTQIDQLPLFRPQEEADRPFELGTGKVMRPDTPYSNRRTLRQVLASCQEYIWWYDPHMSGNALDALSYVFESEGINVREVRLLTDAHRWNDQKGGFTGCVPRKEMGRLKRELAAKGAALRLAILEDDREDPIPHDRFLFAANQAVNVPPINTIHQSVARISEFTPSNLNSSDFESWWRKADVVFE